MLAALLLLTLLLLLLIVEKCKQKLSQPKRHDKSKAKCSALLVNFKRDLDASSSGRNQGENMQI